MSAPTNISIATATDLGVLPRAVEQDVFDSGTTYTVYYKVTPQAPQRELFAWAYGGTPDTGYQPTIEIQDAGGSTLQAAGGANVPITFTVTAGTTYYLRIASSTGNVNPSNLTLQVRAHTHQPITQDGAIIIPSDVAGQPVSILSRTADFVVLDYRPFPNGEEGDIFPNGTMVVQNGAANTVDVYSRDFAFVGSVWSVIGPYIRYNRGLGLMYVLHGMSAPPSFQIRVLDNSGAVIDTINLSIGQTLNAAAVSNDGTVLYYVQFPNPTVIKRWDIINDVALADFTTAPSGFVPADILVLDDDSVVIGMNGSSGRVEPRRFDADTTLRNIYNLGSGYSFDDGVARLGYDPEPGYFWSFAHEGEATVATGFLVFRRIHAEDGVVVETRRQFAFDAGSYSGDQSDAPVVRFGVSFSCPVFIMSGQSVPDVIVDDSIPCCEANAVGHPCDCTSSTTSSGSVSTGSTSSHPTVPATGPILPPDVPLGPVDILSDAYWDQACEGGGAVPMALDPVDSEDWVTA